MTLKGNAYIMAAWRIGLVLALFSIQRYLFYLFNQSYFPDITVSHLWELMRSGIKFDLTATLYTNSLFLLLMIIPLRQKYLPSYQQAVKGLFLLTNALIFAANIADFVYFRYTLRRTDFSFFTEFSQGTRLGSIFLAGMVQYWYLVVLFILSVGLLWWLYGKTVPSALRWVAASWRFYVVSFLLMAITAGLTVAGIRGGFAYSIRPITLSNAGEKTHKPMEIAIVLNTPFSIFLTTSASTLPRIDFFPEAEAEALYTPLHFSPAPIGTPMQKKNVVILILESFTKEHSGYFNHYRLNGKEYQGYTPFLDSLARESLTWELSYANGQKSIDAIPSILGSIPSMVQPFVVSRYALNNLSGLGTLLKAEGYETAFFHGAINESMGFHAITNLLGFDRYFGKNEYNNDADYDGIWGIWDEEFFQFYAREMSRMKEPFATSLFSVTSHHPYQIPTRYEGRFPKGDIPLHQCVGYTDYALRRFFETARQQPWFANTLFVITADHSLPSDLCEQYRSYTGLFSIPILFYAPGDSTLRGHRPSPAQQIDIMPSVLGYLNYGKPYFAFGNDVFHTASPFAVNYLNGIYQWMEDDLLLRFNGKETGELFRLREDPTCSHNLKDSFPETAIRPMEDRLKAFIQQYNNRMIDNRLEPKNDTEQSKH